MIECKIDDDDVDNVRDDDDVTTNNDMITILILTSYIYCMYKNCSHDRNMIILELSFV